MEKFRKLQLSEHMLKAIEDAKFTEPSEIQEKTIPLVLQGKDVLGSSATGSGKTLAFGAGIIEKVAKREGVQALILTPTRELADQVASSLRKFSAHFGLHVAEVYGGVGIGGQVSALMRAEIVVGTPGRILDHLERKTLKLKDLKFLVLDEADRMLDMGFLPDVEKIINACPKERQTLLFSATISPDIERMSKKYMSHPVSISVDSYVDPSKLAQFYYDVQPSMKFSLLAHLLKKEKGGLVMVFCNTRRHADIITRNLRRYNLDALTIHGGITQNKRNSVLKEFHSNEAHILVCTDVAARGLDIKNVSHVYNYDVPNDPKDYIHRIGRTARAGKEGKAITLVSPNDYQNFRNVKEDDSLPIKHQEVPEIESLDVSFQSSERRDFRGGNRGGRSFSRGREPRGRSFGGPSRGRSFPQSDGRMSFKRNSESGGEKRFGGERKSFGESRGFKKPQSEERSGYRSSSPRQDSGRDSRRGDGRGRSRFSSFGNRRRR